MASLLIVVMLHAHVCAALCASGLYSCCNEKSDCCKEKLKSCCDKSEKKEKHDDCQKDHLAFFGTIGQYHFIKSIDTKVFHPPVSILISKIIKQPVISSDIKFAYTGFHPPPPKDGIRVLIQNFLI